MNTESKNENYDLHSKSERVAPYYVNMKVMFKVIIWYRNII